MFDVEGSVNNPQSGENAPVILIHYSLHSTGTFCENDVVVAPKQRLWCEALSGTDVMTIVA